MNNYTYSHEKTADCHTMMMKSEKLITNNGLEIPVLDLQFKNRAEMRKYFQKTSAIYVWHTSHNNKIYIGSAKDLWTRFKSYSNDLLIQTVGRVNRNLIKEVNTHGIDILSFGVIEVLKDMSDAEIRDVEQKYLDKYQPFEPKIGHNIRSSTKYFGRQELDDDIKLYISRCKRGENSTSAKLDDEMVKNIKTKLAQGIILKDLAEEYNVSTTVISNIRRGKTWSHIKIDEDSENIIKQQYQKNKKKFTEELILAIKIDFKNGMRVFEVAKKYNLIYSSVDGIKKERMYGYIKAP